MRACSCPKKGVNRHGAEERQENETMLRALALTYCLQTRSIVLILVVWRSSASLASFGDSLLPTLRLRKPTTDSPAERNFFHDPPTPHRTALASLLFLEALQRTGELTWTSV
jgi:hypothetical protein